MSNKQCILWFTILAIMLCLILGWALRWQVVETNTGVGPPTFYMINRWTGEVRYVSQTKWRVAEER